MPKSKKVCLYLFSFLMGVLFASFFYVSFKFFLFIFVILFILWIFFEHKLKHLAVIFFVFVFFVIGVSRVVVFRYNIDYLQGEHKIEGYISSRVYKKGDRIRFDIDTKSKYQKVTVFSVKDVSLKRGDKVLISCYFRRPEKIEGFDYPGFLSKDKVYSVCYQPEEIVLVERKSSFLGFFDNVSAVISENFDRYFAYSSGFYKAIVLGNKSGVDKNTQDKFSKSGLAHIMAVSGMHLVILSGIIFNVLRELNIDKKKSVYFLFLFFVFYAFLVGFKASIIRASVFSSLLFVGFLLERKIYRLNLLLFTASLLVFVSPLIMVYDVGFQLSFLAVAGIFYFYGFFNRVFKFIKTDIIKNILSLTFSAQMLAAPWVAYKFGVISFIFPFTNILVVPVMPFALGIGILFSFFSFLRFSFLNYLIGRIGDYFYLYIYTIASAVDYVPFSFLKGLQIRFYEVVIVYLIIFGFKYGYPRLKKILHKTSEDNIEVYEMDVSKYF